MWNVEQIDIMLRALAEVDFGDEYDNAVADNLFDELCDAYEEETGCVHPLDILESGA